ncbi:MAG: hypothetical protein IIV90_06830 [Oscillospiraceae bacterium]|nr:hypothetical protein [Oscillospiraceae bacterium]
MNSVLEKYYPVGRIAGLISYNYGDEDCRGVGRQGYASYRTASKYPNGNLASTLAMAAPDDLGPQKALEWVNEMADALLAARKAVYIPGLLNEAFRALSYDQEALPPEALASLKKQFEQADDGRLTDSAGNLAARAFLWEGMDAEHLPFLEYSDIFCYFDKKGRVSEIHHYMGDSKAVEKALEEAMAPQRKAAEEAGEDWDEEMFEGDLEVLGVPLFVEAEHWNPEYVYRRGLVRRFVYDKKGLLLKEEDTVYDETGAYPAPAGGVEYTWQKGRPVKARTFISGALSPEDVRYYPEFPSCQPTETIVSYYPNGRPAQAVTTKAGGPAARLVRWETWNEEGDLERSYFHQDIPERASCHTFTVLEKTGDTLVNETTLYTIARADQKEPDPGRKEFARLDGRGLALCSTFWEEESERSYRIRYGYQSGGRRRLGRHARYGFDAGGQLLWRADFRCEAEEGQPEEWVFEYLEDYSENLARRWEGCAALPALWDTDLSNLFIYAAQGAPRAAKPLTSADCAELEARLAEGWVFLRAVDKALEECIGEEDTAEQRMLEKARDLLEAQQKEMDDLLRAADGAPTHILGEGLDREAFRTLGSDDALFDLLMGSPETAPPEEEEEDVEGFSDEERAELEALLAGANQKMDELWEKHMEKKGL